jgi:hypothetical protein
VTDPIAPFKRQDFDNFRELCDVKMNALRDTYVADVENLRNQYQDSIKTLNATFDARLDSIEAKWDTAHQVLIDKMETSSETSRTQIVVALAAMNERLASMNEFRGVLSDSSKTFARTDKVEGDFEKLNCKIDGNLTKTTERIDSNHKLVLDRIQILDNFKLTLDTKASSKTVTISLVISLSSIVIAIIGLLIKLSEIVAK